MPGTVTLAQAAMLEKQPLKKGIMLGIAQEGVVADLMPWRKISGLTETGIRYDEVIEPDYIPLDGTIATKSVNGKPLSYGVHQMAVHIDIPELLEQQSADMIERQSVRQAKLAIKGAAYKVNDTFINGDQSVDPDEFEGLNKLVGTLDSSQRVGATEIDLTGSYTAAVANNLFKRIDDMFLACEGHLPTAVFCNTDFLRELRSWSRQFGLKGDHYNWMETALDINDPRRTQRTASSRPAYVYETVPFYDLGKKADQVTKVILNNYTEGGATGSATRVFAVKISSEDLEPIQAQPLNIKDIGILENKEVRRKRLTWTHGLAMWGPRSVVKMQGVTAA